VKIQKTTKVIVSDVMNVLLQTAAYRALILYIKNANSINALSNAAQNGYESEVIIGALGV